MPRRNSATAAPPLPVKPSKAAPPEAPASARRPKAAALTAPKVPKTFGACADRLLELKAQKAEIAKQIATIEEEYRQICEHVINTMPKSDAGASGLKARLELKKKTVPAVRDWEKFHEFIRKSKRFDLMQRRPSEAAIQEFWDAKKEVPGVEPFTAVTVSVHKR